MLRFTYDFMSTTVDGFETYVLGRENSLSDFFISGCDGGKFRHLHSIV